MSVLVVAEQLRGELRDVSLELVSAARELGGPVEVAVIGADPHLIDVNCEGVDSIIHVAVGGEEFESDVYREAAAAVIEARNPDIILAGFTVNGMGWAPSVATRLGCGFASDVFAIARDGERLIATRAFYGGKVHAELEFPLGAPVVLMLRPATWAPAARGGTAPVVEVPAPSVHSRTRHDGFIEAADHDDIDLTKADRIVAIGRGIGEQENIELFERLAAKLGATLAVSRPLVDAGWMPSSRQIGQSGKTVKPKVYLAFGISGAVQHLAGMKASRTIIAVNHDPEAAIFGVAHYGAVADIFDIAEELDLLA